MGAMAAPLPAMRWPQEATVAAVRTYLAPQGFAFSEDVAAPKLVGGQQHSSSRPLASWPRRSRACRMRRAGGRRVCARVRAWPGTARNLLRRVLLLHGLQAAKDARSGLEALKSKKAGTEQMLKLMQAYKELGDSKGEVRARTLRAHAASGAGA